MAQNEMKAMCAPPVEVRSMEGLGVWFTEPFDEFDDRGRLKAEVQHLQNAKVLHGNSIHTTYRAGSLLDSDTSF